MNAISVHSANIDDLDALLPLFLAYLDFYGIQQPAEAAEAFLSERMRLGQSRVFIARQHAAAIGFAQVYPGFSSLSLAPSHVLNDLYVRPEARGQSVARALLDVVHADARSCGACEVTLQTAHDNLPAQALYRALGYRRDTTFWTYSLDLPTRASHAAPSNRLP